ncbi:MAG TPA: chloride channel protein, partial [Pontibacter sp.]
MPQLRKYKLPLLWLRRHTSDHDFVLISSVLVGLTAGMAAVALKSFVHYIQVFLSYSNRLLDQPIWLVVFPVIGILITVFLVRVLLHGNLGRGTANILYLISQKSSMVEAHKMYSHVLTSGITAGFGGSAGL